MKKKRKRLTFLDNAIFIEVMKKEPICKMVVEMILGFKLGKLSILDPEKNLTGEADVHGVRFDIYAEDEEGNAIDIEMQKTNYGDMPLRARFYQSKMDAHLIEKGRKHYDSLRRCYVIFICNFNPFDEKRMVYQIVSSCREDPTMPYDDKVEKIFLCTKGDSKKTPVEIKRFLSYLKDEKPTNDLTQTIEDEVVRLNGDSAGKGGAMFESEAVYSIEKLATQKAEERIARRQAKEDARLNHLLDVLQGIGEKDLALDAVRDKSLRRRLYKEYNIK